MSGTRYWTGYFLAGVTLSIVTLGLLACGGEPTRQGGAPAAGTPEEDTPAVDPAAPEGDTPAVDPAAPEGDTPAVDPAAPDPLTQTPDGFGPSFDGYLAVCASPISGLIDVELNLRGFATVLGEFIDRLEAVEPPAEVAAWHHAVLDYQTALKEELDDAPELEDDEAETMYLVTAVFPAVLPYQPAIDAAVSGMDPDVYALMVMAGCFDEDGFGFGGDDTAGGRIITDFASISAGGEHTCGVGTDGYIGCWGDDWNGSTMPPDGEFSSVSAGKLHTCGVRTDGAVACWGKRQ